MRRLRRESDGSPALGPTHGHGRLLHVRLGCPPGLRPLALVVALLVGACSGGGGDAAEETTTTVRRSTAEEVPLAVGDCGDVPRLRVGGALDPADIVAKACTEPHQIEVGAVFDYPAGPDIDFPSTQSVDGYATDQCIERFEPYVGTAYTSSVLDFLIVAPDEDGWDDGDRRIACILYHANFEPLTVPAGGSGL